VQYELCISDLTGRMGEVSYLDDIPRSQCIVDVEH
jgi:hypothetical protein